MNRIHRDAIEIVLTDVTEGLLGQYGLLGYVVEVAQDGKDYIGRVAAKVKDFDQEILIGFEGGLFWVATWKHIRGRRWQITAHSGVMATRENLPRLLQDTLRKAREEPFTLKEADALQGQNWFIRLLDSLKPKDKE